jgi:hypothetical protein
MMPSRFRRLAITPIELIMGLGLLLLLIGFLVPAVAKVREAAARTQSVNNMKQLGLAMHNFAGTYQGKLPPGTGEFGKQTGTIHFFILPYIEQDALFRQAGDAVWNKDTWSAVVPVYLDPRDPGGPPNHVYAEWLATTNYAANYKVFSEVPKYKIGGIPDGTSNTIAFVTRFQLCDGVPTAWGYPSSYSWAPLTAYYNWSLPQFSLRDEPCDPQRGQAIANVMLVGLLDASVRTISPRLTAKTWRAALDPEDGEPLGADW